MSDGSEIIDVKVMPEEELFEVPVMQFLMPNGRPKPNSTTLPVSCRAQFDDMVASGCRFEAEMLTTGEISVTISNENKEEDVDISVTTNGPGVQAGMVEMLKRGLWQ